MRFRLRTEPRPMDVRLTLRLQSQLRVVDATAVDSSPEGLRIRCAQIALTPGYLVGIETKEPEPQKLSGMIIWAYTRAAAEGGSPATEAGIHLSPRSRLRSTLSRARTKLRSQLAPTASSPRQWFGMTASLMILFAIGLASGVALAADEPTAGQILQPVTPLQATFEGMTGDEIFAKLLERSRDRDAQLQQYSAVRTYKVSNDKGKIYAEEVVRLDYQAPDHKSFRTMSEEGSGLVRDLVLKRLIESESETSSGAAHRDSSIKPANYEFRLLGEQDVGSYHCLVVEAIPKRKDKYLFLGRVWIDTQDYAIVRIAGQPAKSLSFWITRADFVRQYQKIAGFWLPAEDDTTVHVRLYGKKILTIDHRDYVIDRAADASTEHLGGDK